MLDELVKLVEVVSTFCQIIVQPLYKYPGFP